MPPEECLGQSRMNVFVSFLMAFLWLKLALCQNKGDHVSKETFDGFIQCLANVTEIYGYMVESEEFGANSYYADHGGGWVIFDKIKECYNIFNILKNFILDPGPMDPHATRQHPSVAYAAGNTDLFKECYYADWSEVDGSLNKTASSSVSQARATQRIWQPAGWNDFHSRHQAWLPAGFPLFDSGLSLSKNLGSQNMGSTGSELNENRLDF